MDYHIPRTYRVASHTRNVGLGSTFVAIPGTRCNGNQFVPHALARGAGRVVLERKSLYIQTAINAAQAADVPIDYVDCARKALATYSADAYQHVYSSVKIIGITGTKGKTTTANMIAHTLRWAGCSVVLTGSIGTCINGQWFSSSLTTPQSDYLHALLHTCFLYGVTYVVMEVAAQALSLHRVAGIAFDTVIMTNISHEHGEFYTNDREYIAAKVSLLDHTHEDSHVLINGDDEQLVCYKSVHPRTQLFGFSENVDIRGEIISSDSEPLRITSLQWPTVIQANMYSRCNAYNIMAAVVCVQQYGISWQHIKQAIAYFSGVAGRMEEFQLYTGATACLDYAHNVASYHAVLSMLQCRFNHVIVVFGASGERDKDKRTYMAQTVCLYADTVVITTDNPRSEDPGSIVADLRRGLDTNIPVYEIADRKQAIAWACSNTPSDSVVAVLGKGRDNYQNINGVIYEHSDYAVIMEHVNT